MTGLARFGSAFAIIVLTVPILFGLIGTILPAFGYLPALGASSWTLAHFSALLAQPGIFVSMAISLVTALLSTAIALAAVFLFTAAYAGTRIFSRLQHAISPFLAVPHAAAAIGLAFLIMPSGMIARLVSPELTGWTRPPDLLIVHDRFGLALTAGLAAKEIPFLLLMTVAALGQVDLLRSREIAASLGYGRIIGFTHTVWPSLYRQIRLAVFAVLAFASSVVDVAAILGPTLPAPLAVRLVDWMRDPDLGMRHLASAGAIAQLGVSAAAIALWIGLERIAGAGRRGLERSGRRFSRDDVVRWAGASVMIVAAAALAGGLAVLVLWSFAGLWQFPDALPRALTLRNWQLALPGLARPLAITVVTAAVSTVLATLLVILWLAREQEAGARRLARLVYLPLLVPQIAFLFGLHIFLILAGADASLPALILVHVLFVLPYVMLSLGDAWRGFDRRYEHVALGLGKGRWRTLVAVRVPMLARPILVAMAVGFAVSIGLYLPTLLIGAGRLETITTEAVALAAGGNRRIVGVYAILQLLLPAAGFWLATLVPALLFRSRRALRV